MAHVVIVGPQALSIENLRGDLIRTLAEAGHRVTAMSDPATPDRIERLRVLGSAFVGFPIQRAGLNPWHDVKAFRVLRRAFRELDPDIVMSYSVKPVIWSGLALAGRKRARYFPLINGLGYVFNEKGAAVSLLRAFVSTLYKVALRRADLVTFQNHDNLRTFVDSGIVKKHMTTTVFGSGVNCERFAAAPMPPGPPRFLLIARLLKAKGLREYVDAARIVKQRFPDAVFELLGAKDPSPDAVPFEDVQAWHREGVIRYLPDVADVRPFIAGCHIYVLPSYHEGLPRTVMEAMAMRRPILTTDVPGCRETVVEGDNGFLVPMGDAATLAERMIWFLEHPDAWDRMAAASRRLAEERFDVRTINAQLMANIGLATA